MAYDTAGDSQSIEIDVKVVGFPETLATHNSKTPYSSLSASIPIFISNVTICSPESSKISEIHEVLESLSTAF